MSTWGKVILTKQGEALLNQCLGMSGHYNLNQSNDPDSDTKGIVITRVSTGRYRYTNTSVEYLKERTDLATSDGATGGTSGFVENLNITGLKPITSSNSDQYGQALIQVQLDNQREDRNIKEEYPLGQLGVFARLEGSTEEILFTIVQYAGDTLPVIPAPVTPTLLNFGFYIAIATTETISIEMEFTGIVTAKQFDDYKLVTDETLNTLNEHTKNTENPHKVTAQQVGLGNVPNVTTNNQTPTFTAASSRTNINSGETLATIFGKIKKWFSDLKTVAFTGSYTDLLNKPTSMQNPNSLTLTMNGSSSSYNGSATASKSWYAPTSAGTEGYELVSNGSGAPVWQQPPYAVCTTKDNVAAKTVSISNFRLVIGARIVVKFNSSHTSTEGATLNVSNTGAKPIIKFGARAFFDNDVISYAPITSSNSWSALESLELVYDGTNWVIVGSSGYTSGGRNSSVITIGSTTDEVEGRYVDYMCNQSEDAGIVIQKAIDLLPKSGGKIILLEGTYYLSTQLTHSKKIIIEGQGKGITKIYTSNKVLISKTSETNAPAVFKNMNIHFDCRTNWSPDVGAFSNYTSLEFDNCSITYANTLHNTDSLFKNSIVKLNNSKITVTLPAKIYDSSHVCWWVFRECIVELTNTSVLFPSGSNNTLKNGVFYICKGNMFGGFIRHIGTTVNGFNSYVESLSVISFVGTQIECRKFSQVEESTGDFNTLSNCRIKILQALGYFNASHISHCDFYISGAIIFCAYCMASNSKLWFSAASLATLRNYCYFEACYVNQSTWISSQGTGVSTTDTKTGISITAPSFINVS